MIFLRALMLVAVALFAGSVMAQNTLCSPTPLSAGNVPGLQRVSAAPIARKSRVSIPVVSKELEPSKFFTLVGLNPTLVSSRRGLLGAGVVVNPTPTTYYLKLYDKAKEPVCGIDKPKWTLPMHSSVSGTPLILGSGLQFVNGIGFCVTAGIQDDDTVPAAAGILINLGVSKR